MSTDERTCALCRHFRMKDYPAYAALGMGRCGGYDQPDDRLANKFLQWSTRACVRFVFGAGIEAREAWVKKQRAKESA